jgi:hypothetical protein
VEACRHAGISHGVELYGLGIGKLRSLVFRV